MKRLRSVKQISVVRRFVQETRAASAVEFGLVIVPFLALLLSIFETGFMVWTSEGLQTAVSDAARNLLTGTAQSQAITSAASSAPPTSARPPDAHPASFIVARSSSSTCARFPFRPPIPFSATLDVANDFYAANATRQFCPGNAGAITVVRVAYPMPVYLPTIVGTTTSTIGMVTAGLVSGVPGTTGYSHLLLATSVFQAEPYGNGTYTPPAGC